MLIVRKDSEQPHRDFRVRRTVVREALTWLLENSRYYRANAVHLNEEALQQLPQDVNLSDIQSLNLSDIASEQSEPPQDQLPCLFPMLHSKGQSKDSQFARYPRFHPKHRDEMACSAS